MSSAQTNFGAGDFFPRPVAEPAKPAPAEQKEEAPKKAASTKKPKPAPVEAPVITTPTEEN